MLSIVCNHSKSLSQVFLFSATESSPSHQLICEECYSRHRDDWQSQKLSSVSFPSYEPCVLCAGSSGSVTTRLDEEFECFICSSCFADHQKATNAIMMRRDNGHIPEFEEPSTIIEGKLYLGPHQSSVSKEFFEKKKISTIVVCCSHLPLYHDDTHEDYNDRSKVYINETQSTLTVLPPLPPVISTTSSVPGWCSSTPLSSSNLHYYRIPLNDAVTETLLPEILQAVYDIIYEETEVHERAVLIHCHQGVSRSATITIAYLMKRFNWNYEEAYEYVKERRPCIYPNKGFIRQLKEKWE
jgi:protein-tyrosine phosphatase